MAEVQGPAWNNSTEYAGYECPTYKQDWQTVADAVVVFQRDLQTAKPLMEKVLLAGAVIDANETQVLIRQLQQITLLKFQTQVLLYNLNSYCNLESAIDAKDERSRKESVLAQELSSQFFAALTPLRLFLQRCPQAVLDLYLKEPSVEVERFLIEESRRREIYSLSEAEEILLTEFFAHGPAAWGRLYTQISGSIQVKMPSGEMGLATAAAYLRSSSEEERRQAWLAIREGWMGHEESVAAILNSLTGWRLETYKKRSRRQSMDYLSQPLAESRMTEKTLNAMMQAVADHKTLAHRALKVMAKALNKDKISAWDLSAPFPGNSEAIPFGEAIEQIRTTFAGIHPDMGSFIDRMVENQWIEGRVLPNKRTGAFCSGFLKSRTQRVFQTYKGSPQDVSTLAHELGHAFHSHIMRDLPIAKTSYPMTLAETASIFAETALADHLVTLGGRQILQEVAWAEAQDAIAMVANIPARFDFEKSLFEARRRGPVSPKDLYRLTDESWQRWYGDSLQEFESHFWMSKLHFSIAGISFYNFPYTFGYLFSLAIYQQRENWGGQFYQKYCDLLRDTGSLRAEDLVRKHLGQDLESPEFWRQSLKVVEQKIRRFEELFSVG